ncbi:hypothetical protein ACIBCA_03055 [Kitasatospora sp. NPDC051170]|uniref:NucA/NucB deoxyribonuclease domain-containing protein n=1 Tax=Kitasatospora sp. NPDC051170 TaxID=3364056 RepID=UPI0037997226
MRRLLLPVVLAVAMVVAMAGGTTVANAVPAGAGWRPTAVPRSEVAAGEMRSDREEVPAGFSKAEADRAETLEARRDAAPGCQVYWPAPYEVCGAIRDKYNELGGPNSFLSFPKSNELTNPGGYGKRTEFVNGPIYWSPQGGAHPVVNHFFAAWARNGYEAGPLGYPTSDEIVNPDNIGRRQYFEHATIYWKLNEAYAVRGAIRDKWGEAGWESGYLGYPVSDEFATPDGIGRGARFEHGMIYWTDAYGAHPVSGGLLDKWTLSGYERGPYGYPVADQRPRGSSWDQDFQFGTMGFPTDPVAAGVPDDEGGDTDVDEPEPVTWQDFADDAGLGVSARVTQDKAGSLDPCRPGESCTEEGAATAAPRTVRDLPIADGPDTQGRFIPEWCTRDPFDSRWKVQRKHACATWSNLAVKVRDTKGAEIGRMEYAVKSGILSSHKSGALQQEFRVEFGNFTGEVGKPTLVYQPTYLGYGTGAYSVDGPASGSPVSPNSVKTFVVTWKQQTKPDNTQWSPGLQITWNLGNLAPNVTASNSGTYRYSGFRCDSTFKMARKYRQGCVVPGSTPTFELTALVPEQTWHVQEAIRSGLPGGAGRPLSRLTDQVKRDINRQMSCPRSGPVYAARQLPGRSCDEYPFASTYQGSALSNGPGRTVHEYCHVADLPIATGSTGYSVCMIDAGQNSRSGSLLGAFYRTQRVVDQDDFTLTTTGGAPPAKP